MKRSKWKKHGKVNNAREGIFFIKLFIISEIIMKIDFTRNPRLLTEGWLSAFGEWNKTILKYIYGKDVDMIANLNEQEMPKISIKGKLKDVQAYARAIIAEKNYLESYVSHGEDAPMTAPFSDEG